MSPVKVGEPFGMDGAKVDAIDWPRALKRVIHDLRSDFIFAPHLAFIFHRAGQTLVDSLKKELKAGKFVPNIPVTIEVPKSFRIRVVGAKRLGPNASRPGSILLPMDRLFYQALADEAAPIIDKKIDHKRSFSHKLAPANSGQMFVPTRQSWDALQAKLRQHGAKAAHKYVLKIDIANYFSAINLHTLINILKDAGYGTEFADRLEATLTAFTGSRSSRGLLQGVYPSDLLGNYYLEPIDRFLADGSFDSARYVDDIYVFVPSVDAAEQLLRKLISELREYDLSIHEGKSAVIPKAALTIEEPDLQQLFDAAVAEIAEQVEEGAVQTSYGFQSDWDEDEQEDGDDDEEVDLELAATERLFDSTADYPGQEENIERFCLPMFSKAESDYALADVMTSFRQRPAMSQIYAAYLVNFIDRDDVVSFLAELLEDDSLTDWSKMWVFAALRRAKQAEDDLVKIALAIAKDATRHDALRAVAAIFVGEFGDAPRRKSLNALYKSVSSYVQAAIYYSSRAWPQVEKSNAKATWGNTNPLNALMTVAITTKPK